MISFGMIDLKISIFITGLDCCNNYSQKAFPNSCSCKYFKGILFFTTWWGQAQICDQYLLERKLHRRLNSYLLTKLSEQLKH